MRAIDTRIYTRAGAVKPFQRAVKRRRALRDSMRRLTFFSLRRTPSLYYSSADAVYAYTRVYLVFEFFPPRVTAAASFSYSFLREVGVYMNLKKWVHMRWSLLEEWGRRQEEVDRELRARVCV